MDKVDDQTGAGNNLIAGDTADSDLLEEPFFKLCQVLRERGYSPNDALNIMAYGVMRLTCSLVRSQEDVINLLNKGHEITLQNVTENWGFLSHGASVLTDLDEERKAVH